MRERSDASGASVAGHSQGNPIATLRIYRPLPAAGDDEVRPEEPLAPRAKVLCTGGCTAEVIHQKGILDEGLQFLSKPVGAGDLLRKVRAVLDAPGPR